MSDLTRPQTQDTKAGISETSSKVKLKRKAPKITEKVATIDHTGKIHVESDGGEQEEYVPSTMDDFKWAMVEAEAQNVPGFEVASELFGLLAHGKDTPYIIYNRGIRVFPHGMMEKTLKFEGLTVEEVSRYKGKIAKRKAEAEQAKKDKIFEEL